MEKSLQSFPLVRKALRWAGVGLIVAAFAQAGWPQGTPSPDQLADEATAFMKAGDSKQARERLAAAVRSFPDSPQAAEAQYLLGVLEKEPAKAVGELRLTMRNYRGSEWAKKAQFQLGLLYILMENYLQGANEFRSFVASYPSDPMTPLAHYWLGISSLRAGSIIEAQTSLEKAWDLTQTTPLASQVAAGLCAALQNNRQYLEAVEVGDRVLEGNDFSPFGQSIRKTLQGCYERLGVKETSSSRPGESPTAESVPTPSGIGGGGTPYSIQVGVFGASQWAMNMEQDLRARGYDVYTVQGQLDGRSVFKVRVGRFGTQAEAEAAAEEIMQKESFKIFIVHD